MFYTDSGDYAEADSNCEKRRTLLPTAYTERKQIAAKKKVVLNGPLSLDVDNDISESKLATWNEIQAKMNALDGECIEIDEEDVDSFQAILAYGDKENNPTTDASDEGEASHQNHVLSHADFSEAAEAIANQPLCQTLINPSDVGLVDKKSDDFQIEKIRTHNINPDKKEPVRVPSVDKYVPPADNVPNNTASTVQDAGQPNHASMNLPIGSDESSIEAQVVATEAFEANATRQMNSEAANTKNCAGQQCGLSVGEQNGSPIDQIRVQNDCPVTIEQTQDVAGRNGHESADNELNFMPNEKASEPLDDIPHFEEIVKLFVPSKYTLFFVSYKYVQNM